MKDLAEQITDALLDMRSDALKARAEREASKLDAHGICPDCGGVTNLVDDIYICPACDWASWPIEDELTIWTVARTVPAPFEAAGVRPLPNGTGDVTRAFPDQCSRVSELVRQARVWNGKARAGYMTNATRGRAKVRQSRARRLLARSA